VDARSTWASSAAVLEANMRHAQQLCQVTGVLAARDWMSIRDQKQSRRVRPSFRGQHDLGRIVHVNQVHFAPSIRGLARLASKRPGEEFALGRKCPPSAARRPGTDGTLPQQPLGFQAGFPGRPCRLTGALLITQLPSACPNTPVLLM